MKEQRTALQKWLDQRAYSASWKEIGKRFGVSESTVHHWWTGKRRPKRSTLDHISTITKLPISRLI